MRIKNKYIHSGESEEGSWAISYGDMVTLLLSFFVLFFSIDFKKSGEKDLDNSLQGIFTTSQIDHKSDQNLVQNDFNIDGMEMVRVKDGTFLLFFKGVSFYNSAKYDLTDEAKKSLREFSDKFIPMSGKYKIRVQAYTDNRLVKNTKKRTFRDNLELSVLRSLSVVRQLNANGIPSRRIEISGKGEMSDRINKLLMLDKVTKKEKESLSRTISLVISRDEDLK